MPEPKDESANALENDFDPRYSKINLHSGVETHIEKFTKSYKINRNWDICLSVSAIVFTLLATITGTGSNSTGLSESNQKTLTGIFGAIAIAIQSASSRFPVQASAKSYKKLKNEMHLLQLFIIHNPDKEDEAQKRYEEILRREAEQEDY